MRQALWLGLSLLLPVGVAHAEDKLALAIAPDAAQASLTAPCFGCKEGLRSATAHYAPDPSPPVPAAQAAPRPVKKPQYAIGDSWKLGGGRMLSVRLTPTPEECAPLVRLSF